MFKVENLKFHRYDNGTTEFYTATLRDEDESKEIRLLHNGSVFCAYETSTNLIYHLILDPTIHSLKELRDGDEVDILMVVPANTQQ
jgi:hypothetical protein